MPTNLTLVSLEDLKSLLAENEIKNEVWGANQAAKYLGISKPTLFKQANAGVIPGVQIGADWKFSSIALYRFVSRMTSNDEEEKNE